MRVVSAYLLALLGGNSSPKAKDIEKILGSVGIDAEEENISKLLSELEGRDIHEVIAAGREKLAAVPSGGGGAVAAGGGGAAAADRGVWGGAAPAEEAQKEEKKEESESDEDMGFSLFD